MHTSVCCISVCRCLGIPAHSCSPLGWSHGWYHLIDAFYGCRWRRSNSIMPWRKSPHSHSPHTPTQPQLQFACTLQSLCAAHTHAGEITQKTPVRRPCKERLTKRHAHTWRQCSYKSCIIKHHVRDFSNRPEIDGWMCFYSSSAWQCHH